MSTPLGEFIDKRAAHSTPWRPIRCLVVPEPVPRQAAAAYIRLAGELGI